VTEHWIIDASPLILLGKAGQLDWYVSPALVEQVALAAGE
jgi:hypothetical protein